MMDLTEYFKMVRMDEIDISSEEKPIIGTCALSTCIGVLLYSEKHQKAIVAHISENTEYYLKKIVEFMIEYKLDDDIVYYKVIEGYYPNHYQIKEIMENNLKNVPIFKELILKKDDVLVDETTYSVEFAFNALTGEFVSKSVRFDIEYNDYKK